MATANVSRGKKQNTFLIQQLHCSWDLLVAGTHQPTFISVLNSFLSIVVFLGNVLILHPPSKHLLLCLATTDLCVGLIEEPLYVTLLLTVVNELWNICRYVAVTVSIASYLLCAVSLLTLDCNKRGQTSCLVVGAEIQTGCNFEASLLDTYNLLRYVYYLFNTKALFGFPYRLMV